MSTRSERARHDYVDSEQLDETFDILWNNGKRDALKGGVHPSVIARRVNYSIEAVTHHFDESDKYTRVDGINPENGEPRESFAPVEEVEA